MHPSGLTHTDQASVADQKLGQPELNQDLGIMRAIGSRARMAQLFIDEDGGPGRCRVVVTGRDENVELNPAGAGPWLQALLDTGRVIAV
jgi:hypothetical protein